MIVLLFIVHLAIALALVGVILLQKSEGGALGMGGGGSGLGGLFSPRGAADTLTRTTAILAALFFLTCLALNLLALHGRGPKTSILDTPSAPGTTAPVKPSSPVGAPVVPGVPTPH